MKSEYTNEALICSEKNRYVYVHARTVLVASLLDLESGERDLLLELMYRLFAGKKSASRHGIKRTYQRIQAHEQHRRTYLQAYVRPRARTHVNTHPRAHHEQAQGAEETERQRNEITTSTVPRLQGAKACMS